ncbi:MFS transporter [Microlunatus soli]|uniref:Drug resistance transporter, EmrB/QacA subfamily n=1 Tax=Microlunatus soli TaxID=630515 RepID=A0A1H1YR72_9ACTN|nr:MFS transporter [Microlunatus soli]SDT23913.1 drug resistance transporter, EmrB/QacA subfamily [Microlunatus soli]
MTGVGLRLRSARGRWVLVGAIAGSSLAMLDGSVVNVVLAPISAELDVGFTGLQWITNAYTLSLAALILIGGVLGDRWGRRRIFLIGTAWFALASLICAASVDESMLIAARALQGIGAALLTPGSLAIISASFDPEDRGRAIGAWSGLAGVATAVAPFLGGWLADISWRLVFVINLPLAAVVIWIGVRHMPESHDESAAGRRLDLRGAALVVIMLAALTWGLTEAGHGWSPPVIGALLVGCAAGVAFVLVERRVRDPLVRLGLFADRVFAVTNTVTLFMYGALSLYFLLVVLQLQLVTGWSPLAAGVAGLPVTILMLLLSARFGALSERVGPRLLMTIGTLLAAGGFLLGLRIGPDASYLTDVLPAAILLGLGLSTAVAPLTAAALGAAPAEHAGAASGINNAIARSAGLLAVAVVPVAAGLSGVAPGDSAGFAAGYRPAMIIGAALLVVGAAVSWFGLGRRPAVEPADELVPVHRLNHCPLESPAGHPGGTDASTRSRP